MEMDMSVRKSMKLEWAQAKPENLSELRDDLEEGIDCV